MPFNINNFNSGDKFLFTMTNLERTELFISKGINWILLLKKMNFTKANQDERSKFVFKVLDLEFPKNITVINCDSDIRWNNIRLEFKLSYKLNNEKEIIFNYIITYKPFNKISDGMFQTNIIILGQIPNQLNKRLPFKYTFLFKDELSLKQNLDNIENYYKNYNSHFVKMANAINNGELNSYIEFWNMKKKYLILNLPISLFPEFYLKFVDYGINFNKFVAIQSFIHYNHFQHIKNYQIIENALKLMHCGKVDDGNAMINNVLEEFKNNCILTEREKKLELKQLEEFKKKVKEGKQKISDYASKLAKEYGFHESFLLDDWIYEQMPFNIMKSVKENSIYNENKK